MVTLATDRRSLAATADDEGERLAAEAAAAYLDIRLRLARLLLRIERSGVFHLSACSSVVQYAVRLGIPAPEARVLTDLGRALEAETVPPPCGEGAPGAPAPVPVEALIRSGQVPVENAALVGKLLAKPDTVRPGEDWFARAASTPTPALRREVNRRIEETAQGVAPLVSVTVHITELSREDFHRARVIASREAAVSLTEGQAFTRIVRSYLDEHDLDRRGTGTRRVGPTADDPQSRYIPADVRRRVRARAGDRCEVPACTLTTFFQFAHIRPHSHGGGREEEDLLLLCHVHHTQFDADVLFLCGWRDGHPVFRDARGDEVTAGLTPGKLPRERAEAITDAIVARRTFVEQVSERPPPEYAVSA